MMYPATVAGDPSIRMVGASHVRVAVRSVTTWGFDWLPAGLVLVWLLTGVGELEAPPPPQPAETMEIAKINNKAGAFFNMYISFHPQIFFASRDLTRMRF